jgi:serine/threonine protein phosphatase PrpC
MGGEKYGEVASRLAADTFVQSITPFIIDEDATLPFECGNDGDYFLRALDHAVQGTHYAVVEFAAEHPSHQGMGSTLTAAVCRSDALYTAHVGDTRLYRLRKNEFRQLTEDHSKVQEMVKKKLIGPEQAKNHPQKNVITQCIGRKKHLKPDLSIESIEQNDLYLLCSDGLTDMLEDENIRNILLQSKTPESAGQTLVDQANLFGGKDNITVVLFQFCPLEINS